MVQPALLPSNVTRNLVELIRQEGLSHGDRLPSIRQLSARMGVRPHIVRDALVQAQVLGHVKIVPRSRAVVQGVPTEPQQESRGSNGGGLSDNEHHLFHLLEARQMLEAGLVQQAARSRRLEDLLPVRDALHAMQALGEPGQRDAYVDQDIRFHLAIARVAGNPVLTGMLRSLLVSLRPFLCRQTLEDDSLERTGRSHADIYRALVAGDPDLARRQLLGHLKFAYDNLLGEVQTLPTLNDDTSASQTVA